MNRQQRRQEKREIDKLERRLYTADECKRMIASTMKDTQSKYNIRYSLCLATTLSAPPFNFGRKRVCEAVKLFFDQIEALQIGTVSEEEIRVEAEKLGLLVKDDGNRLEVIVNSEGFKGGKENGSKR